MLPVRAPIQVTLEDSAASQVHCTRRAAQVKILRRPPRLAKQQLPLQAGSSAIATDKPASHHSRLDPFEDGLMLDDPSEWPQPHQQWPQLKPASHKKQQQPQPLVLAHKPEKLYSAIHTKSHQNPNHNSTTTTNDNAPPAPKPPARDTIRHPNKPPLKTYQERADEYAKARLRILGSAFPDQQQDDGPQVGVSRLLDPSSLLSTDTPAATFTNGNNTDNNNSTRITKIPANNFYPDSNRARQSR